MRVTITVDTDTREWEHSTAADDIRTPGNEASIVRVVAVLDQAWQEMRSSLFSIMSKTDQQVVPVVLLVPDYELEEFLQWRKEKIA